MRTVIICAVVIALAAVIATLAVHIRRRARLRRMISGNPSDEDLAALVEEAAAEFEQRRLEEQSELLSTRDMVEIAENLPSLRREAYDRLAATAGIHPVLRTNNASIETRSGVVIVHSIMNELGLIMHHFSISHRGGSIPGEIGIALCAYVARLLGYDLRSPHASLKISPRGIIHAGFVVDEVRHEEMRSRPVDVPSPDEIPAILEECVRAVEAMGEQDDEGQAGNPESG